MIDVDLAGLDAVIDGATHDLRRRIEAHGLGVEQCRGKGGGVMAFDPGRDIDEMGEARGVALGEAVFAKAFDLVEAALGEVLRIAARSHAADHLRLQFVDGAAAAEGRHGAAKLVGLGPGELGGHHGEPHRLLLEQRHAHGLAQHLAKLVRRPMVGMRRGEIDGLVATAAAQVWVHHVALDRAWTHDGDLDDEVVEAAGLQPRQHVHLRPALHLEHADGIGAAEHVVDLRIVARHGAEREAPAIMLLDQGEGLADASEHAEPSTSTFNSPSASRSSLSHSMKVRSSMAALPMGTTSDKRPARQHEAADMLGEVAREADQLLRQFEHAGEQRIGRIEPGLADVSLGQRRIAQAPDGGGERRDRVLGETERLADFADRRAAAIGDHGRGDAGAVATVAPVDILDHLLAPLMLEIDVDIGRLFPLRRDEALEQQIDLGRVHIGDGEAVADRGVGRRAAALAENADRAARNARCRGR